MNISPLEELAPLQKYRETRQHIFPSEGSMQWWMRQHKTKAIAAGALLLIRGTWFAHSRKLDDMILAEGELEASTQGSR